MNTSQLLIQASGWFLVLVRSSVLIASTIIVLFVAWVVLHLIWSRGEQAVIIKPFVVVDPSGNLRNADSGFAQILLAQMAELQDRILRARAVLTQAASGQSVVSQTELALSVPENAKAAPKIVELPWPRVQASASDKVELKVQGVDIPGLVSWLKAQLIPEPKGLAFTAHIASDGEVTMAGDVSDMNIEGVNNIYLSQSQRSPIAALNDLALQLFKLRLVGDDGHLRDLPLSEFRTLIGRLNDTADTRITSRPDVERRKWYRDLSAYFSGMLESHADWAVMMILAAETARRGGDYSSAYTYFDLASRQSGDKQLDQKQSRTGLLNDVAASLRAPAAAYSRMSISQNVASDPVTRRVLDDKDTAGIEYLRAAFRALYNIHDGNGYSAVAGLHGVPGWYSWNHQHSSRSSEIYQLHLPWYRAFLANFERAARAQVPGFSLRCWDWTKGGIPVGFSEPKLQDGQMNPLAGYNIMLPQAKPPINRFTRRDPNSLDELPSVEDVNDALSRSDWSDFADRLEDLGDRVHGWVAGDMGVIGTGAYDPIFYAHHCNIDRLWATWQKEHEPLDGPSAIDPKLLDIVLDPFGVTVRDVLDTRKLGYIYE